MAYRKKAYTQREEVMENNAKYFINFKDGQRAFHELEILQRRALRLHKSLDELLLDAERDELLYRTIDALPETQRRRFLLHYEYDYKLYEIGRMEPQGILKNLCKILTAISSLWYSEIPMREFFNSQHD